MYTPNKKQNFPTKKTPISDGFTGEFQQIFKEASTVIVHRLFLKCKDEKLPISFCEDSITLVPNQTMKRNQSLMNIHEISKLHFSNLKINQCSSYSQTKNKNHMTNSTHLVKA